MFRSFWLKVIMSLIVVSAMPRPGYTQHVKVVKFDALQKILASEKDEIQVINFWATWCAPCVKELPLLEKLNDRGLEKVKITLISLDYADKMDNVNAFIARKNIKSRVLLLDEIDYNSWIDKVEKHWSGAIPATLIINSKTKQRKFLEKGLNEGDLEKLIEDLR
jgi:thiol-disulfide isomerase/thioredoxin